MKNTFRDRFLFVIAILVATTGFTNTSLARPTVTVVATNATATIGTSNNGRLTFTRAGSSTATALTVNYTLGGTAVKWTDYRTTNGDMPVSVTIPAGSASTTMTIQAVANTTNANPETATFTLSTNSAYAIGTAKTATITILPAPSVLPTVGVVATNATATMGTSSNGLLTFTRTGSTTSALTVNYALGGSAVKWDDYRTTNGDMPVSVVIPAGSASTTMAIVAEGNETNANPETATFTLSPDPTYTIGTANAATIAILPAPPVLPTVGVVATNATATMGTSSNGLLTFTRTGSTTNALTVNYALSGTAVKWNDYRTINGDMPVSVTIPAGSTSTTMTIQAVANTTNANPETAIFTLSPDPAYTIGTANAATIAILSGSPVPPVPPTVGLVATNATATIGTSNNGLLTFTRTGDTTAALTVNYALGGTAVKLVDYQTINGDMPVSVTIPAGSASTTMTIQAVANTTNANPETATFTLASNASYTIGAQSNAILNIISSSSPGSGIALSNSATENAAITLPRVGDNTLHILSPTVLELERVNTQAQGASQVDSWNFVDSSNNFHAPATSAFAVTVNGLPGNVQAVGFKRRPRYAPLLKYDLRIDNCLYLQLATPIADGQTVVVQNSDGALWPSSMQFTAVADPLRYSPAIHVNQEGYVPTFTKKAMIGYYLGNLGEMPVTGLSGFSIVDAKTGTTVFQGTLTLRPDIGYNYTPMPYQNVLQADFSSLTTPGEYQLVVPGLGASLPFLIDDGIAMGWMRTYSLGLYHRRSGMAIGLPFTRFAHDADHTAAAQVPSPQSLFPFTWTTIASKNSDTLSTDPADVGPQLNSEAAQLYPFVNTGSVDVSGGHFDAGDYSKYTTDCAALVHNLMFTVDAIPGAAALDNLGIPESGDGIPDILQEAKWEADYIAKLQDADGGFYFIVYPKDCEYEQNTALTNGDDGHPQVVWPKNTSATAASVAALAQCASSPAFKKYYPATAALYLQKATLGWQFLMNAIAKYGKDGSYQKVTFYGDDWIHNDEIAWAACEMYLATGDPSYQQQLFSWFPNPSDPATYRWNWIHMAESYGNAIRSYAFAARTGRLQLSQLDPTYLAKCNAEIVAAGDKALLSSNQNAYATSFPQESKLYHSAGWYFSVDAACDLAVAYQINPNPAYIDAIVGNMNYEGGTNPLNTTYITGLGLKRQHNIVDQYSLNSRRALPPDGIPLGNIQTGFDYLPLYGATLSNLTFPSDSAAAAPYPFYDRWADTWNVTTEFVGVNQARSILALSALVNQTSAKSTPWTYGTAQIILPTTVVPLGVPTTLSVQTPGLDLTNARVVWEARDQQPDFGSTYTISPVNNGDQWVEVEVEWPDGRRAFATGDFQANSPVINWVNEALPAGATTGVDGGDAWTWITSNPTPYSAPAVHQSNVAAGFHDHWFDNATATLAVNPGDNLFAYVYLDPTNPPTEVMLMWTDTTGSAEHRAYWGANEIPWGVNGTANQFYVGPLPAAGQWVRLAVPASAVGLEGRSLRGIRFALFDGRATWDITGKSN